jgi:hypothetical protein
VLQAGMTGVADGIEWQGMDEAVLRTLPVPAGHSAFGLVDSVPERYALTCSARYRVVLADRAIAREGAALWIFRPLP